MLILNKRNKYISLKIVKAFALAIFIWPYLQAKHQIK